VLACVLQLGVDRPDVLRPKRRLGADHFCIFPGARDARAEASHLWGSRMVALLSCRGPSVCADQFLRPSDERQLVDQAWQRHAARRKRSYHLKVVVMGSVDGVVNCAGFWCHGVAILRTTICFAGDGIIA